MSDTDPLEPLRREAKRLLQLAQAHDTVIIAKLREHLPRLASLSDDHVASSLKLADVQHAIARSRGQSSWAALKTLVAGIDPDHTHAARFLLAVLDAQAERARAVLAAHPDVATYNLHTAAAAGNDAHVAALLAEQPALARAPSVPDGTLPIIYAVTAPVFEDDVYAEPTADMRSLRITRLLLDAGADANSTRALPGDEQVGLPVLYFACMANRPAVVKLLLERGADPNDGESVYHAAERDARECLDVLLAHGADISRAHAHWGNTPLYFLAGHSETSPQWASTQRGMTWLLEHGADPNVPSIATPAGMVREDRAVPLHRVAAFGHVDMARTLVAHGAIVDVARGDGRTPLALAVRTGNRAVAEYLESVGADGSRVSRLDRFSGACARGDADEARALRRADPSLPAQLSVEERSGLTHVIAQDRVDAVALMLDMGWSLTEEDAWAGTPLHHAAWHGRPTVVALLLARGAPVDVRDREFGSSPLAWAAHGSTHGRSGHDDDYVAVVAQLLDAGSARDASYNRWTESPESMASPAVVRLLRERGFIP